MGRTIGVKLRYDDFHTVTRDLSMPEPTADAAQLRRAATECVKRVALDRKIRLLGVRVSALTPAGELTPAALPVQTELPFADNA